MSSGPGTKESHTSDSCEAADNAAKTSSQQKKKRPRIRNRPRNKSNVLNATTVLTIANSASEKTIKTENQPALTSHSETQLKSEANLNSQRQVNKLQQKTINEKSNNECEKSEVQRSPIKARLSGDAKACTTSQSLLSNSLKQVEKTATDSSVQRPKSKAPLATLKLGVAAQSAVKPSQSGGKITNSPRQSAQTPRQTRCPLKSPQGSEKHPNSPVKSPQSLTKPPQSPTKPPYCPGSPTKNLQNTSLNAINVQNCRRVNHNTTNSRNITDSLNSPTKSSRTPIKSLQSPTKAPPSPSRSPQTSRAFTNSTHRIIKTPRTSTQSSPDSSKASPTSSKSSLSSKEHSKENQQPEASASMSTPSKLVANAAADAASPAGSAATGGKTREEIMAEREAKKLAKKAKKVKADSDAGDGLPKENQGNVASIDESTLNVTPNTAAAPSTINVVVPPAGIDKAREQIKAEREAKKLAKQALKAAKAAGGSLPAVTEQMSKLHISDNGEETSTPLTTVNAITAGAGASVEEKKKPVLTKAERRAIQEAQRAAKAQALTQKNTPTKKAMTPAAAVASAKKSTLSGTPTRSTSSPIKSTTSSPAKSNKAYDCKVRLFNHLESARQDVNLYVNNPLIHPTIARLGEQYAKRTIVGSNARCIAFLNALKTVIQDFETPPKKEFARSLETTLTNCIEHLQKCRPLAVSVTNAYKHIKHMLTQLPTEQPESELKNNLCRFIETYIENQIEKAAEAISCSMQKKISNGDVILTFGCSSLINYIFEEAQRRNVDFRVIVVDSRPFCEGQELLRRLTAKEIPCSYVLINAIGFIMPEATKVLLGAHALLANGYVMARTGTAQVALVAHSFNVPVLVCCETHKFSERYQTDAIVYNELGNPDDLVLDNKCCLSNWQSKGKMSPLNLMYDITPSELVTAVVTEVSILPCTSVPVILRIKPTEIGYS